MKPFTFRYRNSDGVPCNGTVTRIRQGDPLEAEIEANGWMFHVIVGTHWGGNYICIPNWSIGSEIARLEDEFWNCERLREYAQMNADNANIIAKALAEIDARL